MNRLTLEERKEIVKKVLQKYKLNSFNLSRITGKRVFVGDLNIWAFQQW